MIVVQRVAALGLVLLAGACARLPNVPTAYSALPALSVSSAPARMSPARSVPDAPVEASVDLLRIVIPGTMTVPVAAVEPRGINPSAALDSALRTRMAWEALRPADLLKPAATMTGRSASTEIVTRTYDREAMMDRLLKGGRQAASGICSGC